MALISFGITIAQDNNTYIFRHIDQNDGLAHNNVFDITQDKRGFIWVITTNGLQRYDGSRFISYTNGMNTSYGFNQEANLYTDSNNILWIPQISNIKKLDIAKNIFTFYQPEQLIDDPVCKIDTLADEHGKRWLLTDKAIYCYDSLSRQYKCVLLNNHAYAVNESNYFFTGKNTRNVWSLSGDGLILLDKKAKKVYSGNYNPNHNSILEAFRQKLLKSGGRGIMMDRDNNFWATTWGGLFYKYDAASRKIYTYSLADIEKKATGKRDIIAPSTVSCIFQDTHGAIWVSTYYSEFFRYDIKKNAFTLISLIDRNKQKSLFNFQVYSIFQDKEENIWLGTDNGIAVFNPYRRSFQSADHEEANKGTLPKSEILSFIQSSLSGEILVGTWGGGITIYDSALHFKKNILVTSPPYEGNLVWSLIENDNGNIWAGCQHGYIDTYDPVSKTVHTIHPSELGNSTIRCMAKDSGGNIWMGLHNGKIAKWSKAENKFYAWSDTGKSFSVTHIFIDKSENCWICTEAGLKKFDTKKMRFTEMYLAGADNSHSVSLGNIEAIEQYDDTTLMIGASFGGLSFFNTQTKAFSSFTAKDGFPSNTIHSIKKDTAGCIWFTTDYQLYRYKPADKKFIRYNIDEGTINTAFIPSQLYALKNGKWATATSTEMISFDPASLSKQNNNTPQVEIAGLKIFDSPFFIDSFVTNNRPVTLTYGQNFLTIEYTALNFSNILKEKYYYRLSGINNSWVDAGSKNFATYTNLEPGEYVFTVKSDNGNKVSPETSFKIIIKPPFWKTTWFIAACLLLTAAVTYMLVLRRIKTIRYSAEMKQKIAETEMIALRAQMNPHFIFNCLNSIDSLMQTNEKEKATGYLAKFARLIRAILENSKSNAIACWKDLETLKLYLELEKLRWDKKFSYELTIAPEILQGDYKVPPMIIQPYVENAIHHGLLNKEQGSGRLLIEVKVEKNCINYCIEDNGIGRKKAMEYKLLNKPTHQSMGLDITRERINLFNHNNNGNATITDLYDTNHEAAGTRVTIRLIN